MPVTKTFLGGDHGEVVVRHTEMIEELGAILFIHGLGDSRQAFREAFEGVRFDDYNLLAVDLPGCGSSPGGDDYSLEGMVICLEKVLNAFKVGSVVVVGHGLGADIGVRLCLRNRMKRVRGFVSVEGSLCRDNLHVARMAAAGAKGGRFARWYREEFMNGWVHEQQRRRGEPFRRYYESLEQCRPAVFLSQAQQMREQWDADEDRGERTPLQMLRDCRLPLLYCWGAWGFPPKAREVLERENFAQRGFDRATHWVMVDQPEAFYGALLEFARACCPQPTPAERLANWFRRRWMEWLAALEMPPRRVGLARFGWRIAQLWRYVTVRKRTLNELRRRALPDAGEEGGGA